MGQPAIEQFNTAEKLAKGQRKMYPSEERNTETGQYFYSK